MNAQPINFCLNEPVAETTLFPMGNNNGNER